MDPEPSRRGRHLVPDELVRAATYRLTPDRVARAKVHGAAQPDDPTVARAKVHGAARPDDPDPRPSVPRPRSS